MARRNKPTRLAVRSFVQFVSQLRQTPSVQEMMSLLNDDSKDKGTETLASLLTMLVDWSGGQWNIEAVDPIVTILAGHDEQEKIEKLKGILVNAATLAMLLKSFALHPDAHGTSAKPTLFACSVAHQGDVIRVNAVSPPLEKGPKCSIDVATSELADQHAAFWEVANGCHEFHDLAFDVQKPPATESFDAFETRIAEQLVFLYNWAAHVSSCTMCLETWLSESDDNPICKILSSTLSVSGLAGWHTYKNYSTGETLATSSFDYGSAQLEEIPPAYDRFKSSRRPSWKTMRNQYLPFIVQREATEEEVEDEDSEEQEEPVQVKHPRASKKAEPLKLRSANVPAPKKKKEVDPREESDFDEQVEDMEEEHEGRQLLAVKDPKMKPRALPKKVMDEPDEPEEEENEGRQLSVVKDLKKKPQQLPNSNNQKKPQKATEPPTEIPTGRTTRSRTAAIQKKAIRAKESVAKKYVEPEDFDGDEPMEPKKAKEMELEPKKTAIEANEHEEKAEEHEEPKKKAIEPKKTEKKVIEQEEPAPKRRKVVDESDSDESEKAPEEGIVGRQLLAVKDPKMKPRALPKMAKEQESENKEHVESEEPHEKVLEPKKATVQRNEEEPETRGHDDPLRAAFEQLQKEIVQLKKWLAPKRSDEAEQ